MYRENDYKTFPALKAKLLSREVFEVKKWMKISKNPIRIDLRKYIFIPSHLHHQYLQRIIYSCEVILLRIKCILLQEILIK